MADNQTNSNDGDAGAGDGSSENSIPLAEEYSPVTPDLSGSPPVYDLSNVPESWSDSSPVRRVEMGRSNRSSRRGSAQRTRVILSCNVLVFLTSVCVMVLELTASRLVARHIGNSIYTWTSVIGVVLAGITLGNFLGGWLADRFDRARILPVLFLVASVLCYSVLWADRWVSGQPRPEQWRWSSWVLLLVVECYLLPSMALGTISPVLASLALSNSSQKGMTVGSVYAWGAFGSIIGTFITGFFLIETWGTRTIIGGTALVLAALSLVTAAGRPALKTLVLFGWMQWVAFTLLVLTATPYGLGGMAFHISDWFGGASSKQVLESLADKDVSGAVELTVRKYPYTLNAKNWTIAQNEMAVGSSPGVLRDVLHAAASQMDDEDLCEWLNEMALEGWVDDSSVEWLNRGWSVGDHLQQIGFTLWLRPDIPGDYHDESRYSYINVGPAVGHDADTISLRLDKLVHSFYSPTDPTRLYYEYEQVYAAVTELALETREEKWELDVSTLPYLPKSLESGDAVLPEGVSYDAGRNLLEVQGGLSARRIEAILGLAHSGEYWKRINELRKVTSRPDWGGFTTLELERFPAVVSIPDELSRVVTYDRNFKHLVAYERVSGELQKRLINASSEACLLYTSPSPRD